MRLDVWFLIGPFVYFHTLCVRTAKALARLCGCAGSPESSLVAYVISTKISWAGSLLVSSFSKTFISAGTQQHLQKREPAHDKTNKMTCAPSEVPDQPGHPPSLIRVFVVRMKKPWVLSYPLSTQRRLSDQTGQMVLLCGGSFIYCYYHVGSCAYRNCASVCLITFFNVPLTKLWVVHNPLSSSKDLWDCTVFFLLIISL